MRRHCSKEKKDPRITKLLRDVQTIKKLTERNLKIMAKTKQELVDKIAEAKAAILAKLAVGQDYQDLFDLVQDIEDAVSNA